MTYDNLRKEVFRASRAVIDAGLVSFAWGNVSGVDRAAGVFGILPADAPLEDCCRADVVVLSLKTGEPVDGNASPAPDAPLHLYLYQQSPDVGGIVHVRSAYATSWAQARRAIPCLGAAHADYFNGAIPVARPLTARELRSDYKRNLARTIVECLSEFGLTPGEMPGVLLPHHGPVTWGPSCPAAVRHAVMLEEIARIAYQTLQLDPAAQEVSKVFLNRHYLRDRRVNG